MSEASAAAAGGAGAELTPSSKSTAPKDKPCPFCNQAFTSSSLGRHLDLYIKEKNPKPSDGIHPVDEIRKMRGSITRRQTRNSSAKRESLTPTTSKQSSQDGRRSPALARPLPGATIGKGTQINNAGWEVTGVMLDLPSTGEGLPRLEPRRGSPRQLHRKTRVEQSQREQDALDTARAAELALREILGIVRAATVRSQTAPSPFDFDPFTLTFPALVLRCLPLPPTLFSVQPFPTPSSCSLDSPTQAQFEALIQTIRTRYQRWRSLPNSSRRKDQAPPFMTDMNSFPNGPDNSTGRSHSMGGQQQYHEEEQKTMRHVQDAFAHWKSLPEKHRQDVWRLEILRAYSREQDRRKEIEHELERTKQGAENLRAQVDQLSKCQHPREFLVHPVQTVPLPKETATELQNHLLGDPRDWEYESLVNKWKGVIQTSRRSTSGMNAQRSLTPAATPDLASTHHSFQTPLTTKTGASHPNTNTAADMSNGFDAEADEDDEELDDAPADQPEHATMHGRAPQAMMDRGVLDPNLHANGGHPSLGGMDGVDVAHGYDRTLFRV
ncbi:MAG: hypothetical protein M1837_005743 [Sclerophora amabilis]|nr:MAG: hypothetical protein M1837_005743 [Sclerophora amabilis]